MRLKAKILVSLRWLLVILVVMFVVFAGLFTDFKTVHSKVASRIIHDPIGPPKESGSMAEASMVFKKSPHIAAENNNNNNTEYRHALSPNAIIDRSPKTNTTLQQTSSNSLLNIKERFDERLKQALGVCKRSNYTEIPSLHAWNRLAFGRLKYCSIPKSGTTFLTRDLAPSIRTINQNKNTNKAAAAAFSMFKRKRFFLVRDPYSRLVSAYFSKIVGHPRWWDMVGNSIIKKFRQNATETSIRCGHDATFPEYIKFVIHMHKTKMELDAHFLRMTEVCNICTDVPDYIVKMETIREDLDYILKTVECTGETNKSFVEVANLAKLFMSYYASRKTKDCGPMCPILNRYWYGQQATGLISEHIDLPVRGQECDSMTGERLADLAQEAYLKSVGKIDKHQYKLRVMAELFRKVPIEDRREIQKLLNIDCELFGYDPEPDFLFPELYDHDL